MADIAYWFIKIVCFVGASWTAIQWINFVFTFDYREQFGADVPDRIYNLLAYAITLLVGVFPVVALAFIGMNIQRVFD